MPAIAVDTTDTPFIPPALPAERLKPGSPIWVEVRPNLRRIHVLGGDILSALGKRRDLAGKGRNEHDDVAHAVAWLRADHTTHLVITEAQRLHPLILRSLDELGERAGVTLWLLHAPPRSDAFTRALARRCDTTATYAEVPQPLAPAARDDQDATCPPLPIVPAVDFTRFLTACRDRLPSDDTALVLERFRSVADQCQQALSDHGATARTIAELVRTILSPAPADAELTTAIRALQVAAWHHDLYIKVDLARLLHSEERPRVLPADAARALLAYRQPYRAITAALTQRGLGVADISAIPIRDTDPEGAQVNYRGFPVSLTPDTARAVRAQLHLRQEAGAESHEALLPQTPKALAKALTDAAIDLNIRLQGRRAERTRPQDTSCLRRVGITVASLP